MTSGHQPVTTTDDCLLTTIRDGAAHLVLNRSERLNAVNVALVEHLHHALSDLERRKDVAVVCLSGQGRAFCAGSDVKEMERRPSRLGMEGAELETLRAAERARMERAFNIVVRISELPQATIAGLRGPVAGAGIGLALACDFRIAGDSTVFVPGFSALGLPGDWGVSWFLTEKAGKNVARRMLLRGERLGAAEALAAGMVDEVVPDHDLDEVLSARTEALSSAPAEAISASKSLLHRHGLPEALAREIEATLSCQESQAHATALQDFLVRSRSRERS